MLGREPSALPISFPETTLIQRDVPAQSLPSIPPTASVVVEVDLGALVHNYQFIRSYVGSSCQVVPVVKANAYGLGAHQIAPTLHRVGASSFFVATIEEGLSLRKILPEATIYILNGIWDSAAPLIAHANLTPVLSSLRDVQLWKQTASQFDHPLPCILQAETGLTRLGIHLAELKEVANTPCLMEGLDVHALMSHLACAYQPGHPYNHDQKHQFDLARSYFPHLPASLAGSGGLFQGKEYLYNMVRPGRLLYGSTFTAHPSFHTKVRPTVTIRARILQIQDIQAGQSIGYDQTAIATTPTRLATLGIGYADGYFRSLSNQGFGMIGGIRVPVVGRVSMDLLTVDVTHVPEIFTEPGSWVELMNDVLTVDTLADQAGTVAWEVLTRLGDRPFYTYKGLA